MTVHDVAVIGAGVVGCAVARELSGLGLDVVLIDSRADVGDGTSKANTAILHTGFDAVPGSVEARLVARGYELLSDYAVACGIPVERTGAVLVAWTDHELEVLPKLREKAVLNGYLACELITADEVRHLLPSLAPGALGGLTVPGESIICPWTTPLAYATEALARGTVLALSTSVSAIEVHEDSTVLRTNRAPIECRWVINAAGLGADYLDAMFGHHRFTVTPRRGELLVFDKQARALVDRIVLPVPTERGKGVLISPTIFGNVMLGPTSQPIDDRSDTSTSEEGFDLLCEKGRRLMPQLLDEEVTAAYTGLRASTEFSDYVIDIEVAQRYVLVGGIRSTGLTASLAIAEYAAQLLADAGLAMKPRNDLPLPPVMPNLGEAFARPYESDDVIAADPEYGQIVCFCERVTRGEIRDAFASPIPPADLDGLRRRTRAQMGRCQGFYCGAQIEQLLEAGRRQ